MKRFLLAKHVYVCAPHGAAVLLDLNADQFYGLDLQQTPALASVVEGWPRTADNGEADERAAAEVAHELHANGLLTECSTEGKSAEPVLLPSVESALYEWDPLHRPRVCLIDVLRMALAFARAKLSLRFRRLSVTVNRVAARKAAYARLEVDRDATRRATGAFQALRPFFYTCGGECLFDSLVLVEFLASYKLFPTWIIGVTGTPFSSHSWVQLESDVLNDAPEYVRSFTPILAV